MKIHRWLAAVLLLLGGHVSASAGGGQGTFSDHGPGRPALPPLLDSSTPGPFGYAQGRLLDSSSPPPQAATELEVRTVPALPGLEFRLFRPCSLYLPPGQSASEYCFSGEITAPGSWSFTADETGVARLQGPDPGLYYLQVNPWQSPDGGERAEFSRWDDDVFTAERAVEFTGGVNLVVGMNIHRQVRLAFQDLAGKAVPADRVSTVIMRSSFGAVDALEGEGPHWILAERSLRRDTGLESVPVVYAVQRVEIDGSNVVNRGQLRLVAEDRNDRWTLPLLLYSARFEPRDALFGGPVGGTIVLELTDGRTHEVATGPNHTAELSDLARGTYRAWVTDGPGIGLPTIVVLSRDQLVRPMVMTYLDLSVVGVGGIGAVLGLLFAGRPHLLPGPRGRTSRRPTPPTAPARSRDRDSSV